MLPVLKQSAFILNLCLTSLLQTPTFTAAYPKSHPPPNPSPNNTTSKSIAPQTKYQPLSSYTGDVLNITKCYCEDPTASTLRHHPQKSFRWGHYYLINYYNYHLSALYTLSWTCHSPKQYRDRLPTCWDKRKTRYEAKQFPDGNHFGYQTGFDGLWGDGQDEHYFFNGQKRGLPSRGKLGRGKGVLGWEPRVCERLCAEQVDGMVLARDADVGLGRWRRTWWGPQGNREWLGSEVTSYVDLDDMCERCK